MRFRVRSSSAVAWAYIQTACLRGNTAAFGKLEQLQHRHLSVGLRLSRSLIGLSDKVGHGWGQSQEIPGVPGVERFRFSLERTIRQVENETYTGTWPTRVPPSAGVIWINGNMYVTIRM